MNMGINSFRIELERSSGTFLTSQPVSGSVKFVLTSNTVIRGVKLTFEGGADVVWTDTVRGPGRGHEVTRRNAEKYLNQTINFEERPNPEIILPPGEHKYPFCYYLPPNIPTSFEGLHGHVRYVIKGVINRPWRFVNECTRTITVICPLDLNLVPGIQEPIKKSVEKVLCCGWCSSDPLTLVACLPVRGFVPGQETKALIEADNQTKSTVGLKCNLIQKVTYTASDGRRKHREHLVAHEYVGGVSPGKSLAQRSGLKVPLLPASLLRFCNCIDISYFLQVRGMFGGVHNDVMIDIPITVGTIPLVTQFDHTVPHAVVPRDYHTAFYSTAPTSPFLFAQYSDIPPPSYEECVLGNINIRSTDTVWYDSLV